MTRRLTVTLIALLLTASASAQLMNRGSARSGQSKTERLMNLVIPEVRFVEQPFIQVMDWLEEFTGANIQVRWETLEFGGVDRETPISLQAQNVRLSLVLWMVMNEAAGADVVLAYRASGDQIILSTADDLGREVITRVYDVADLMIQVPSANRPQFDFQQGLGQQGGGGQSVFGNQRQNQQRSGEGAGITAGGPSAQMQQLIELLQQVVEPDTWEINGGQGRIRSWRNLLVVTNTLMVHQQLAGYVEEDLN